MASHTGRTLIVTMPVTISRALLIVNPASRRGGRVIRDAKLAFEKAGVVCDAMMTESPGHAADLAKRFAAKYDAVFTLGGDGTAIDVLGALAHSGPPVGILPGGTGNIVARTLGTSMNIGRAVNALLAGEEARIDLGRLHTGRRFAIGMGIGLDATMIEYAPGALKRRLGFFAYVVSASRAFVKLEKFDVRLTVDGEVIEMRASAVMIANFGAVMNDLLAFGHGIERDDGLLDACVYSPRNQRDALRILWKMARKNFAPDPCVFYRKGSSFRIEAIPPRMGQADGELLGNSPFEVMVEPLAGRVLVPRQ